MTKKLPSFITEHVTIYVLGLVGLAVWAGVIGWLDVRHIQRLEHEQQMFLQKEVRLLDKIDNADIEVSRLNLYNTLGSVANTPARNQIILDTTTRKAKYERELKTLQDSRPKQ